MKANRLLKSNIVGLLKARGANQRDLSMWCRHSQAWLSKILNNDAREFSTADLDRIADFFGLVVYQLFQPGIVSASERRRGVVRRTGKERRTNLSQVRIDRATQNVVESKSSSSTHLINSAAAGPRGSEAAVGGADTLRAYIEERIAQLRSDIEHSREAVVATITSAVSAALEHSHGDAADPQATNRPLPSALPKAPENG